MTVGDSATAPVEVDTPVLDALVALIVDVWPEHGEYLTRRFAGCDNRHLAFCEALARKIWRLIDDRPATAVGNYRWTCEKLLEEEYHFVMTGRYRYDSFARVLELVYSDARFMTRYTDGLLLSQLTWANHARSLEVYECGFLPLLRPGMRLLEVGPGHGLLLAIAAQSRPGSLVGWDVSAASLRATGRALATLGVDSVHLQQRNLLEAEITESYDLVVASELVEHVDQPAVALRRLAELTSPHGWLYLNVPVNSPAPDHITLWRSPEDLFDFIEDNRLRVVERHIFPMTGWTEEAARRHQATLSCVAICRRDRGPGYPR